MRRIPWVSDDRMVVLQAICDHYDMLANRGIELARIGSNREVKRASIGPQNEVSPACVNTRGPANPDGTGVSTDGR